LIRTLDGDCLIGEIGLDGIKYTHGDAFVGISLGERDFWGKGYGTDAMRVLLRFAFTELNLRRVSLDVFEYNPRAVRSYEKVGFVVEGACAACSSAKASVGIWFSWAFYGKNGSGCKRDVF